MKLKIAIAFAFIISLASIVRAGTVDSNTFQSTFGVQIDLYPTNQALISVTNALPAGLPPGNATAFTNGNYQAFLDVGLVMTNGASGCLTNSTTHAQYPFGSITQTGTNYETVMVRLGPNEIYGMLTNQGTGIGVIYSETRN
jgi:hypothetical protein